MKSGVWIGLVGVTPRPGADCVLNDAAKGAFVNVLAYATNEAEFRSEVEQALHDLGLTAHEFEDIERFAERLAKWEVDDELQALADEVEATQGVRFGTFHNYTGLE
jgi:hypothetical protein